MLPFSSVLSTENHAQQFNTQPIADHRLIGEKMLEPLRSGTSLFELPEGEANNVYHIMLMLQPQNITTPYLYISPPFTDGSMIKVDFSESGKVTVTVMMGEATIASMHFSFEHEAYQMLSILPLHQQMFSAWQTWCNEPLTCEELRCEAVIKVMQCIRKHSDELDLSRLNLTSIPTFFPGWLQKLKLNHNNLTEIPPMPVGLIRLNLDDNALSALPSLKSTNLKYLSFRDNNVTMMPDLPNSLEMLYACRNNMHLLPKLPDSIKILYLNENQLVEIHQLPAALVLFSATDNQLTFISQCPGSLNSLFLARNKLTQLSGLPGTLQTLDAEDNKLLDLPALPGNLRSLNVGFNKIKALPALPGGLEKLVVRGNQLSSLPELNRCIHHIDASLNYIDCLPLLINSLRSLKINNNRLKIMPPLPHGLYKLDVRINNLQSLFDIPDSLHELAISDNPQIKDKLNSCFYASENRAQRSLYTLLDNDIWNRMSTVANFTYFQTFIFNLSQEDSAHNTHFRQHAGLWLNDLAKDNQLQELTFAAAASSRGRVTQTWCTLQSIHFQHKNEALLFACTPEQFLCMARQIYRAQLLDSLVADKIHPLDQAEDGLGFYLHYLALLKAHLQLDDSLVPCIDPGSRPPVSLSKIKMLQENIRKEEATRFHNWLAGWSFCHRYLHQRMSHDEKEELMNRYRVMKQRMENQIMLRPDETTAPGREQQVIARTDVAIYGLLAEKTFFTRP